MSNKNKLIIFSISSFYNIFSAAASIAIHAGFYAYKASQKTWSIFNINNKLSNQTPSNSENSSPKSENNATLSEDVAREAGNNNANLDNSKTENSKTDSINFIKKFFKNSLKLLGAFSVILVAIVAGIFGSLIGALDVLQFQYHAMKNVPILGFVMEIVKSLTLDICEFGVKLTGYLFPIIKYSHEKAKTIPTEAQTVNVSQDITNTPAQQTTIPSIPNEQWVDGKYIKAPGYTRTEALTSFYKEAPNVILNKLQHLIDKLPARNQSWIEQVKKTWKEKMENHISNNNLNLP